MPVSRAGRGRSRPKKVDDGGRRQRRGRPEPEPGDRADVLLELRGRGALDRPVAAVVDARRQLVDDERSVGQQEQLDGERAAQAHRDREPLGRCRRAASAIAAGIGRGRDRLDEDAVVVDVPSDREGRHLAIRPARDDDRQLRLERELASRPAGRPPARPPSRSMAPRRPRSSRPGSGCGRRTRRWSPSAGAAGPARPATPLPEARRSSGPRATAPPRPRRLDECAAPRSDPGCSRAGSGPGRTGTSASSASTTAGATCSSSYVMTAHVSARRSAARRRRTSRGRRRSATTAAGHVRVRIEDGDPIAHRHGPPGRASGRAGRRRGCRSSRAARWRRRPTPSRRMDVADPGLLAVRVLELVGGRRRRSRT